MCHVQLAPVCSAPRALLRRVGIPYLVAAILSLVWQTAPVFACGGKGGGFGKSYGFSKGAGMMGASKGGSFGGASKFGGGGKGFAPGGGGKAGGFSAPAGKGFNGGGGSKGGGKSFGGKVA